MEIYIILALYLLGLVDAYIVYKDSFNLNGIDIDDFGGISEETISCIWTALLILAIAFWPAVNIVTICKFLWRKYK